MVLASLCEVNSVVLHCKALLKLVAMNSDVRTQPGQPVVTHEVVHKREGGWDIRVDVLEPLLWITHLVFRHASSLYLFYFSLPVGHLEQHIIDSPFPWFTMAVLYFMLNNNIAYNIIRGILRRSQKRAQVRKKAE
eukprot:CFRG4619T1